MDTTTGNTIISYMRVGIIGTGKIGKDLLYKLINIPYIKHISFVGRREITKHEFPNLSDEILKKISFSGESIQYFITNPNICDVVFDCTSAFSAHIHNKIFREQKISIIDLTPSNIGEIYIPYITPINRENINLITCGAQSVIPALNYLKRKLKTIEYIEIISQISSESAGIATRNNIDNYIETTQNTITKITGINNNKVILNINPSPKTTMVNTIYIRTHVEDLDIFEDIDDFISNVKRYLPKYFVSKPVNIAPNTLSLHINVIGNSDFLSNTHGNLDIINCAAIEALNDLNKCSYTI